MPLAIGSLVFVEIRRPHFYAAQVVWVSNFRFGWSGCTTSIFPGRRRMIDPAPEPSSRP